MKKHLFLCLIIVFAPFIKKASAESVFSSGSPLILLSFPGSTSSILNHTGKKPSLSLEKKAGMEIKKKSSFLRRISMVLGRKKLHTRTYQSGENTEEADKIANGSLMLGAIALATALVPWYTIALAIPLGIIAVTMGLRARKMGSSKPTGKTLGVIALIAVAVWIGYAAISVATF